MFHWSGARKKKGLTDLVKIIPFPGQLRERATAPKKNAPSQKPKLTVEKPEPKVMTAPSGRLSSSSVSIKKMLNPQSAGSMNTHIDADSLPMNDYDFDDLKIAWRQYAFKMKEAGNRTFHSALVKRDPILVEGSTYRLEVDNQTQIDSITLVISEFVNHLRATLKNYGVDVKLELTTNPEEEVKFLNGKDKFAALARKNPNLHSLKNTFNLDIEF